MDNCQINLDESLVGAHIDIDNHALTLHFKDCSKDVRIEFKNSTHLEKDKIVYLREGKVVKIGRNIQNEGAECVP